MPRLLTAVLVVCLAACHRSSPSPATAGHDQPAPPAGTGMQQIVMNGSWGVVAAERIDVQPAEPNAQASLPLGLFPVFDVIDGQLRDFAGSPLFEPEVWDEGDFYANETDGRTLWFEVYDFEASQPSMVAVQMIFGSSGPDDMIGFVTVRTIGAPVQGQFLTPHPGVFLVHMRRVGWPPGIIPPPTGPILPPVDGPVDQPTSAR